MSTPDWNIPYVPENVRDPAAGVNLGFQAIDEALTEVQEGAVANPMTAPADLIVGGVSGAPARLAKGAALQVLRMNSDATAHEYADLSGGAQNNPTISTDDDNRLQLGGDGGLFVLDNLVPDPLSYYILSRS